MIILPWVKVAAVAIPMALLASLAGVQTVRLAQEQADHARDNAAADKRQTAALEAVIKRHNETTAELRANNAALRKDRERADVQVAAASAAADSERRIARRVRDASATDLLAARAAIEAAGAGATCRPALEAADLRQRVLEWCEGAIGRLGGTVAGLARYADALKGDDAACRADYKTVTR